jgi:hypothetical protein
MKFRHGSNKKQTTANYTNRCPSSVQGATEKDQHLPEPSKQAERDAEFILKMVTDDKMWVYSRWHPGKV